MTDKSKDILERMASALDHHANYLHQYAKLGKPPDEIDEDETEDEEEESELCTISEDLQIIGGDLERLINSEQFKLI